MRRVRVVVFGALATVAAGAGCSFDGRPTVVDSRPGTRFDAPGPVIDSPPGTIDAMPDTPVSTSCDEVCPGTCSGDVCVIDCTPGNPCSGDVICPPGFACEVNCHAPSSGTACSSVVCAPGQPCTVVCEGGPGVIGGGPGCGNVDCNGACSCAVTCINGTGVLGGGTGCQNTQCLAGCDQASGCLGTGTTCDTCP